MRAVHTKTIFGVAVVDVDGQETMVPPVRNETPEQAAARWVRDAHSLTISPNPRAVLRDDIQAAASLADIKAALLKWLA